MRRVVSVPFMFDRLNPCCVAGRREVPNLPGLSRSYGVLLEANLVERSLGDKARLSIAWRPCAELSHLVEDSSSKSLRDLLLLFLASRMS